VLYLLNHASNPFYSNYFGDGLLIFATLDHKPTILSSPLSLGWQVCATTPSYCLSWDFEIILGRARLIHNPPDLRLPCS
jgi:hypothetical protein